jgi:hypothetical protein
MKIDNACSRRKTSAKNIGFAQEIWRRGIGAGAVIATIFLSATMQAQTPATLTDLGTTAPTPGFYDISQLSTAGQADMPDGLNYYTDNQSNHSAGEPGQTFTTVNTSTGYVLNSLAIKTGGGTTSGTGTAQSYLLHIYSVSGNTTTVLATYSASNFTFTDGDWLRWSGLSVALSPNAVYAYSFGKASSAVSGWEAMGNASGNLYAGGEIGLMPVAGGTITFGSSHSYDAVFDVGLASTGAPSTAVITNTAASAIQATAATLNGQLINSGGSTPQIKFFYGPNDGGTNSAAWSNNVALGPQLGNFSATVTGLKTNATYFFTGWASNNIGVSWAAPSKNFTTLATVSPATVTNLPATGIAAAIATLNGQVLTTGNQWPTVRLYYGTSDGGSNSAAWANQVSIGVQSGFFNSQIAGLSANTTYYFTTSVSNSAGVAWAAASKSFLTLPVTRVPVLTYHYDNTRQGQNTNETLLTLANVNVTNFGKLFSYAVDGYVYCQPLILTNVNVAGSGVHDVVFVATEHDSVYAFDANSNFGMNGGLLWKTNLGIAAISPSTEYGTRYHTQGNTDLVPEEGATGTPVIDPVSGTIYLDAFTREVVAGVSTNYYHRIHALNITNGTERISPVVVAASVPGRGVAGNGSVVAFQAIQHLQRPALTLAGGILYVCYGSHGDTDPYHGWVMGFNPTNLVLLTNYVFNTTPNANSSSFPNNPGEGALWMGGNGLCVDANTNLYFETGNGSFSANTNGGDYSDSFVKLSTTNKLAVADYFTPYNQSAMAAADTDLGSGGPLLLPDSVGSTNHPHLIVGGGKAGIIHLVDRDNMGHYNTANDNQIVQEVSGQINGVWSSPAYWNNLLFYNGNGDVMKNFVITNGVLGSTLKSQSSVSFGFPGATPVISANGTNNGIAWATDPGAYASSGPAVLHAYNATNLAQELYNTSMNLARDNPGGAVKMTVPVIAGGKVYVGAEYALSVYGPAIFLTAPTISPTGGAFTNSISIALVDATPGVSIFYTLDGTAPTAGSMLYARPFNLTSNAMVQAVAVASGAVNSAIASASFINTAAAGTGLGLTGAYFTNHTSASPFTGPPVLVQTNATINFNWGTTGPSPVVGATNFTVRWTGTVQAQFGETYNFYTVADDGVRLYLNGQLVINDWVDKTAATTNSGSLALAAQQFYSLELDYYQKTNNASVALWWSSPSTVKAVIPQTQLYPFTNPPPAVLLTAPAGSATNFTAAASVTLSAEADANYNPISAVNFFANSTLLGSATNLPYTITATGIAAGSYALTAVAVDGSGLSSTSAPVNITVANGSRLPYGLTSNANVNPFLNLPMNSSGTLPALLSGTGAFSNTTNRTPAAGLIPYAPNAPQWKDNAIGSWLMALPNNGGSITPGEQIQFQPTNAWAFPAGSVFVKNFDLVVNETNASVPLRRLETEVLVRDNNGSVYGVNYKWRPDNSDADLLPGNLSEDILVTNATGVRTQTWYYASPADCQECHNSSVASNPSGINVLGVNARQLNGNFNYPATGVTDNQLRTLNRLGLLNPAPNESAIGGYAQLLAMTNAGASLQDRVRSYLDVNCEQCHQPGGQGPTWDARFETPLAQQDITNYPAAFPLDISDNACIVKAKDVWRSVLVSRINTLDQDIQMPDFRNLIDTNAVAVITTWINSLPGTPALAPPTITPDGGDYIASINVTLSAPDTNAVIYYTLDGSLPTTNSFRYAGAFNVFTNVALAANAFETNYDNSVTASALFFVQPLYFASVGFQTNRQLLLGFVGVPGSNYVLQATTNFSTWTPISTNAALTNQLNLLDPQATNFPYRYYRVLQQ